MNDEMLKKFCNAWISEEPSREEIESGDADESDVALRWCFLDFFHHGNYSIKFRNQGFNTSDFGKTYYGEDKTVSCPFYSYVSSTDVNYYDAEFKFEGRAAYAVSFYREEFSNSGAFTEMSDMLGQLFDAVRRRDYKALADSKYARYGFEFDETGKITIEAFDSFDLILTVVITPIQQRY